MSAMYVGGGGGGRREKKGEGRGAGEGGKDQTLEDLFTAHLGLETWWNALVWSMKCGR